ncbi:DUF4493 domain-containing protein [Bacteroides helcogenes]|uniref:DUF4493 domain-containing protein n=1 Tax=Bacteroides helcogenes (strain ATCC 35417 / DSM 20613 / JCM 6297 / CCUG 15421 / P 36-108) TaxID=693979 RepID=E6SSD3_BACT6|nr:DUF4493 domain-containing protein [Bacteroides helcogenes]ADV45184.1 hypothetical protein Bache_3261 [Bacteroides helcogenes P 36-108]MDY5238745.1 DUF4493 domain-containing protein [Bacteroides helcogenes]
MKRFDIITLSVLAIIALASCELRDELKGNLTSKTDTGALELSVAVKQPAAQTRADINTGDFPVVIEGKSTDVADVKKEYATVAEMPASVSLAVGTYTVTSHTPGTLEKKMDRPYYGGSTEMTITKGITTTTNVTCKMKNSRLQMNYGDDFKSNFQAWTITIDDGTNTVLSYDHTNTTPEAIYWAFDENAVTAITINIKAKTTTGNTVSESRTFKKSDAAQKYDDVTDFFNGGDALDINMGAVESSTGNVTGITITTNITFENHGETVEIPVDDETGTTEPTEPTDPTDPTDPDTNAPTLKLPTNATYSVDGTGMPASADALITATDGLKSIVVKITAGNDAFDAILTDLKMDGQSFITGVDLIDNADFDKLVKSVIGEAASAPHDGDTEYTFQIGVFFTFLNITGATDSGKSHQFDITVTDKNGKTVTGTYQVTITE